jgi:quinolinate synthase
VHEEFRSAALSRIRALHPEAAVLVHPESPQSVIEQADVVGSTTALINAVVSREETSFIVATDKGIFNKMKKLAPGKTLMEAPTEGEGATCQSCARCPWMGMNSLQNLLKSTSLRNLPREQEFPFNACSTSPAGCGADTPISL